MKAQAARDVPPDASVRSRGLVACLAFAALTGSVVAGLGQPIVLEIARERDVSIPAAQWVPIITLLVGVVATPVLARIADGRLRRGVLVGAMLVVAIGSLVGALVPSFAGVLVGRALQGLGYAMVPLTVSIARERLEGVVLHRTLGILSTSIAVGVGLGNPLMGLCVKLVDYRAAFLVAVVVSASGALWVWRRVPPAGDGVEHVATDVAGAVLLGGGLGSLLLAVSRGATWGWQSWPVLVLAVAGVLLLTSWLLVELRLPDPLVDLRLTFGRGVLGANLGAALLGFSVFGGVAVVILLTQRPPSGGLGLGFSVFVTGLVMMPMALASLVAPFVARWLGHRIGVRHLLPIGSLAVACSFGVAAVLHHETWHIVLMMGVLGIGIGIAYSAMPALIVTWTPEGRTASAIGINQILRLVGGSVGIAVMTAVIATYVPAGASQPEEAGYVVGILLAVLLGVLAALVGWVLVPHVPLPAHAVDSELHPD